MAYTEDELVVEAAAAVKILGVSTGFSGSLDIHVFLAASVWAPLSPSIVIPNMISMVEEGLSTASRP